MSYLPPGFKTTALGPLPEEWEVVRLGDSVDVCKISLNPQNFPNEMFEYYSIPAYQVSLHPALEMGSEIRSQKLLLESETVLFGKLNPRVPKVWLIYPSTEKRQIASTEFIPLSPSPNRILNEFLYYLCWSDYVMPCAQELVSGSTPSRQRVDVRAFLALHIPLPPLPEQQAIAHVLRTVQQAKEATEKVIATIRELKKSLMRHLFTYGPVSVEEAETVLLKETEIGPVPEHWVTAKLGSITEKGNGSIQTGPFGSLLHASDYVPYGIPFVMPKDLSQEGRIMYESVAHISSQDFQRLDRYHLKAGDLLVARRGEIGRRGLVTDREAGWVCGTGCLRIRPGSMLYPPYMSQVMGTTFAREWLKANAIGTTMANLNTQILGALPIPFPPIPEQQEIARILGVIEEKISAEENRKRSLETLFKTLLHHLMTGKLRLEASREAG